MRIIHNALLIRLEICNVHGVKTNQSHEKTQVQPRKAIPSKITLFAKLDFQDFQGIKYLRNSFIVSFLASGKTTAIYSIIHLGINQGIVELLQFTLYVNRVQIEFRIFGKIIKFEIQHA